MEEWSPARTPGSKRGAAPVALRTNNRQVQRGRHTEVISSLIGGGGSPAHVDCHTENSRSAPNDVRPAVRGAQPARVLEIPLAEAVKSADESDIKGMLDHARTAGHVAQMLDERNLRRQAPLHIAADAGRCGVVQLLLDYDASINVVDGRGGTALHIAGACGHTHMVQVLLKRGAKVLSDKQGQTSLHRAAHRGHAAAVAVMLHRDEPWFDAFADSFERGEAEGGSTPLHSAFVAGHAAVVNAIMSSFSHDSEMLEKLRTVKDRWGVVPAELAEGQAPAMLTACVRETLQKRQEAQREIKEQQEAKNDEEGGIRWCENPSAMPKLPTGVQRKLDKEARERSKSQFETLQREIRGGERESSQQTSSRVAARESGDAPGDGTDGGEGWETPRTIRKTSFNFELLPSGEVDLECIYQRCYEGGSNGARCGEEAGRRANFHADDTGYECGTEEDFIDEDCEFEFNFDWEEGSDYESQDESSDEES